jgi:hypothetical protein
VVPPCRAKLVRLLSDDAVTTLGPVTADCDELNVHIGAALERLVLAPSRVQRLQCTDVPRLAAIDGLRDCRELRSVSVVGAFESAAFLAGLALDEVSLTAPVTDLTALATMPTLRRLTLQGNAAVAAFRGLAGAGLALDHLGFAPSHAPGEAREDWKAILHGVEGLRSLVLRRYALESVHELPPLPALEELDLSYGRGFLELDGAAQLFPRLRRLVLTGTGMKPRDVPRSLTSGGIAIVH